MNCDLVSGDEPSPWWSRRSRKSETFDHLARLAFGACPALLDLVGEHRFDRDLVVALTVSIIQLIWHFFRVMECFLKHNMKI